MAMSLSALVVVVVIDYATGYEFMFHTFYSIPVSIAAWYIGRRAALGMSVASAIAWWVADTSGGHVYSHPIYGVWNALVCLGSFAAGGILLAQLRQSLAESRRNSAELKAALAKLQKSTAKVRELEDALRALNAGAAPVQKEVP
jgi:hypothetical protein